MGEDLWGRVACASLLWWLSKACDVHQVSLAVEGVSANAAFRKGRKLKAV